MQNIVASSSCLTNCHSVSSFNVQQLLSVFPRTIVRRQCFSLAVFFEGEMEPKFVIIY